MRIQHNIMAMNAYRNLNFNNNALSGNLEKLSSGYRINRAGDDAAGLAISEKMRMQITGLDVAQDNAQSGINLVQTAEGALTEVHDMLNRMYELAEQSANGTLENENDRAQIQKEVNALIDEIDRIADGTNFNGINLLDGSLGAAGVEHIAGTPGGSAVTGDVPALTGTINVGSVVNGNASTTASFVVQLTGSSVSGTTDGTTGTFTITIAGKEFTADVTGAGLDQGDLQNMLVNKTVTIDGQTFEGAVDGTTGNIKFTASATGTTSTSPTVSSAGKGATTTAAVTGTASSATIDFTGMVGADLMGGTVKIGNTTYSFVEDAADAAADTTAVVIAADADASAIVDALVTAGNGAGATDVTITEDAADGNKLTVTEALTAGDDHDIYEAEEIEIKFAGMGLNLQIGDTSDDYNQLRIEVDDCHASALDLKTGSTYLSVATQNDAKAALDTIENAINYISDVRGGLGASQNRLEHTINNLAVTQENIQEAESTVRDTDVADEMMEYTKNNILIQSAQAMLAQANQAPQGVLQLLG